MCIFYIIRTHRANANLKLNLDFVDCLLFCYRTVDCTRCVLVFAIDTVIDIYTDSYRYVYVAMAIDIFFTYRDR